MSCTVISEDVPRYELPDDVLTVQSEYPAAIVKAMYAPSRTTVNHAGLSAPLSKSNNPSAIPSGVLRAASPAFCPVGVVYVLVNVLGVPDCTTLTVTVYCFENAPVFTHTKPVLPGSCLPAS